MRPCDEYAALLDDYVDGELTPAEADRVRDHLTVCPGCRAYVDDALAIRAAFPDAEDTEVPEGFAEGVSAAIRAGAAPRRTRRGCSTISRSSAVMYGSHSAALMIRVSTLPMAEVSFTWVGKAAPPMPTMPAWRMMSTKASRLKPSKVRLGWISRQRVF